MQPLTSPHRSVGESNGQTSYGIWSALSGEMVQKLRSAADWLTGREAQRRLSQFGPNLLTPKKRSDTITPCFPYSRARLSFFLHDHVNALIILVIAGLLEFQPLPLSFLLVLGATLLIYIVSAESLKKAFYSRVTP